MAKILTAEDEPDIQALLSLTLRHSGHTVVAALDGLEALRLAAQELPDLILLDVQMPKMNGIEVCKKIKADPNLQNIPVVFLSVRGDRGEIKEGLTAGATEYLVKPFSPAELIRRVNDVLARFKKA